MASGFGVNGTRGRCNPFWTAFDNCLSDIADVKDCEFLRDNYIECLHHRKEFARMHELNAARAADQKSGSAAKLTEADWNAAVKKNQEAQKNDPKLQELLMKYNKS